jgi:hypothetical protein
MSYHLSWLALFFAQAVQVTLSSDTPATREVSIPYHDSSGTFRTTLPAIDDDKLVYLFTPILDPSGTQTSFSVEVVPKPPSIGGAMVQTLSRRLDPIWDGRCPACTM